MIRQHNHRRTIRTRPRDPGLELQSVRPADRRRTRGVARLHGIVVKAGGQNHEVALMREMVELNSNRAVLYVFELEAEGVSASSGGWEAIGGCGVCADEE